MEPGKLRFLCKYPNCTNKYYYPVVDENHTNKRFYVFPRNKDLQLKWKSVCSIDSKADCTGYYLCEDHFTDNDFKNETRKKLIPNAVPRAMILQRKSTRIRVKSKRLLPIETHSTTNSISQVSKTINSKSSSNASKTSSSNTSRTTIINNNHLIGIVSQDHNYCRSGKIMPSVSHMKPLPRLNIIRNDDHNYCKITKFHTQHKTRSNALLMACV